MKISSIIQILLITAAITGPSCKKDTQPQPAPCTSCQTAKTVSFVLYTDKDFSSENGTIIFTLQIGKSTIGRPPIWDSVLPPMKIKDIPVLANKLVIEKTFFGKDDSDLPVGFYYTIENVGNSWHIDALKSTDTRKTVEFNFQ